MNYIYVDSSASSGGDGSQLKPYQQLTDVLSLTSLTHPVSILLKRGLVYNGGNIDSNYLLYNLTSEMSYIDAYGDGENPVISQRDTLDSAVFVFGRARNLTISNLDFIGTMSTNAMASISPTMVSGDVKSNVWITDCNFLTYSGKQQAWKPALWFTASSYVNGSVGYFGLKRCSFNGTARGVWIMGNANIPSDATDNNGDRYYGNGIRVEDCSFCNIGGDGVILSNATSLTNPLASISDTDTSGIFRCTYSSRRNDFPSQASIAFWLSNCNKVVMDSLHTDGCVGAKNGYDKQAYDFDILCHDCLLQYSYSKNTSGFLITSNYASQVTTIPSGETAYSWYYTKGYGNKNNTVRYCTSFNDGCYVGRPKIIWQGYTFNLNFQNVTFIDTVNVSGVLCSMFRDSTNLYTVTDSVYGISFENVIFYTPNATSSRMISSDSHSGTTALVKSTNSLVYSSSSVTSVFPTDGSMTGNISSDPMYLNIGFSSPGDNVLANKLSVYSSSPIVNGGTDNAVVDLNGNSGNSIGAIQY